MIVSGCAGSFVVPDSLGPEDDGGPEPEGVLYFGSGRNSSAVYLVVECFSVLLNLFLVLAIAIFFHIFANGKMWSPSALFFFWWCCFTRGWLFLWLGLNLYQWFRSGSINSIVSRRDQPIFF